MNNIDKKASKAWEELHERLKNDQLLMDEHELKLRRRQRTQLLLTVAAVSVLFVVAGILFLTRTMPQPEMQAIYSQSLASEDTTYVSVSTLQDGSVVYLSGYSTLNYPKGFSADKREVTLNGEAYFDIQHQADCPFFIHTEGMLVEVLGTAFSVRSSKDMPFELMVEEGKVLISHVGDGATRLVTAGEGVRLIDGELILGNVDGAAFTPYFEKMFFTDQKLSDVCRVLNAHIAPYKIEAQPEVAARRVTFFYEHDEAELIVQMLAEALQLTYSKENETFSIMKP